MLKARSVLTVALIASGLGAALALAQESADAARCVELNEAHNYASAIAGCTKVIESSGESPDKLARDYYNRGSIQQMYGHPEQAIADFTNSVQLNRNDYDVYLGRGAAYVSKGEFDLAIADYGKAIEVDPKPCYAYNDRAEAYLDAGKAAQGLPDAETAITLCPDYGNPLRTKGNILEALGRKDEAIAVYKQSLVVDPLMSDSADALIRLGAAP